MKIDKDTIIQFLRERGDKDTADKAAQDLPGQVDTEEDRNILDRLGIDIGDLLKAVKGGGLGGVGKTLGGFLK